MAFEIGDLVKVVALPGTGYDREIGKIGTVTYDTESESTGTVLVVVTFPVVKQVIEQEEVVFNPHHLQFAQKSQMQGFAVGDQVEIMQGPHAGETGCIMLLRDAHILGRDVVLKPMAWVDLPSTAYGACFYEDQLKKPS